MNNTSSALTALTGALAALPAYAQSDALAPQTGYRFTYYSEGDLPAGRAAVGRDVSRFRISTHQLSHEQALGTNWRLDADLMVESMSGASPWFITPGANGQPVQVMSGASIEDHRNAVNVRLGRAFANRMTGGITAALSSEDDYRSIALGVDGDWETPDRQRTYSAGLSYSDDELEPTDGGSAVYPDRIVSASKRSLSAFAGLSQILGRQTVAQAAVSFSDHSGFLSDPYKLVYVEDQITADQRPNGRMAWALSARLRHFVTAIGSALRLDWRHFRDDWGIVSDTVHVGLARQLDEQWRLGADLRWYEQSQADFYGPYFSEAPVSGLVSSDYRLSPYGALSLRLGATYQTEQWSLALALEDYRAKSSYALKSVAVENPGLVEFQLISLAFSWRFDGSNSRPDATLREPVDVIAP